MLLQSPLLRDLGYESLHHPINFSDYEKFGNTSLEKPRVLRLSLEFLLNIFVGQILSFLLNISLNFLQFNFDKVREPKIENLCCCLGVFHSSSYILEFLRDGFLQSVGFKFLFSHIPPQWGGSSSS
jgi:hypothetical protein